MTRPRPVPTVSSISMRRLSFGNGLHSTISGAPMARLVFAARIFSTKRIEAHHQAWRDHRDWTAWKYAMWKRGEKFPHVICVPESTSTANIKLNERVLLRPT
jgi:hypothetical protein